MSSTESTGSHRMEVRLSNEFREMLDYCCDASGYSKAKVIRMGIEKVYNHIERNRSAKKPHPLNKEAFQTSQAQLSQIVYDEVYKASYGNIYDKEYAKLVVDPRYNCHEDVSAYAHEFAHKKADEVAVDAIYDFFR